MKTIILQSLIRNPKLHPTKLDIYQRCCRTVKRYAKNIGCDYVLETSQHFKGFPPHFEMFRILAEKSRFGAYDLVLFIDADVFARNTTHNIFQHYDSFTACVNPPGGRLSRRPEPNIASDYMNSGIVLFDRHARKTLDPHYRKQMEECKRIVPGRDQLAINRLAYRHLGGYTKFDPNHACYLKNKEAKQAILVHLAGRNRQVYLDNQTEWDLHFEV